MLADQATQMGDVLRGLGRAHHQSFMARQPHAIEPPQVQRPFHFQCNHAAMARLQPDLQLREQALRGPHEFGRSGGQRGEFELQVELLGQLQPRIALRALAIGCVQCIEQARAEAPRHTSARQSTQITPSAAAGALQDLHMLAGGAQHFKGQVLRQVGRRRFVAQLQPEQAERHERGGTLRALRAGQRLAFSEEAAQQALAAAPQPQRCRHFQQQRFIDLRHARRELQSAPAPGSALVFM
jgi:hypothetical protein